MKTLYIDARTYNNDTSVSILNQPFMDCVLEATENIKPEDAGPTGLREAI